MRTAIIRPLITAVVAVLAFSSIGTGAASAEPFPSDNVQVAVDQDGRERSAVPTETGLKLNTAEGDSVNITDNVASWRDQAGNTIASINLDNEGNQDTKFRYDEATQTIAAESASERNLNPDGLMSPAACMPKWVAWAFNITWGGLVCIPASLAAGGIATPIAGILTGAACEAAGGAMVTAVSC
jgi:hypothetical protein